MQLLHRANTPIATKNWNLRFIVCHPRVRFRTSTGFLAEWLPLGFGSTVHEPTGQRQRFSKAKQY
jgi:hypothetical protein